MVVFGRQKGYRGSYKQWEEDGIPPQVVFEVLSPGNRDEEMARKLEFYTRYGVEEYYLYDPDNVVLSGWLRSGAGLQPVGPMHGWVSPRLRIRFDLSGDELVIVRPDGRKFLTFLELEEQQKEARRQAQEARRQAEEEQRRREEADRQVEAAQHRTEEMRREAEEARRRAERLAERLRALGIDPEA
jgi:Uma2 family endonuclease